MLKKPYRCNNGLNLPGWVYIGLAGVQVTITTNECNERAPDEVISPTMQLEESSNLQPVSANAVRQ